MNLVKFPGPVMTDAIDATLMDFCSPHDQRGGESKKLEKVDIKLAIQSSFNWKNFSFDVYRRDHHARVPSTFSQLPNKIYGSDRSINQHFVDRTAFNRL